VVFSDDRHFALDPVFPTGDTAFSDARSEALKSPTLCYARWLPFQRLAVVCRRFNPPASAGSGTRVRLFAADGLRTARTCSRNHVCAASFDRRGGQLIKYGKGLISRGGSITRRPASGPTILANVRGTVRIKSVCRMAKTAGIKKGILNATRRF
jgi:hypothetical protein